MTKKSNHPCLRRFALFCWTVIFLIPCTAHAQSSDNYFSTWFDRVTHTQAEQPHWITPMFTTTPRLEEEFRFDIARQSVSGGHTTDNYGLSKGLELIPTENTEIIFSLPSYLTHISTAKDWFGDVSFLFKYRLLTSNEEKSNYILTAFLGASVPTGMYKNGAPHAVITPTIAGGKGWGPIDFQSTLGIGVPVEDPHTVGTPIACNTAVQYHVLKKL